MQLAETLLNSSLAHCSGHHLMLDRIYNHYHLFFNSRLCVFDEIEKRKWEGLMQTIYSWLREESPLRVKFELGSLLLYDHTHMIRTPKGWVPNNHIHYLGMDLTTRTLNALASSGILSLRQLLSYTKQELLDLKNIGERSLIDIENGLEPFGIALSKS